MSKAFTTYASQSYMLLIFVLKNVFCTCSSYMLNALCMYYINMCYPLSIYIYELHRKWLLKVLFQYDCQEHSAL